MPVDRVVSPVEKVSSRRTAGCGFRAARARGDRQRHVGSVGEPGLSGRQRDSESAQAWLGAILIIAGTCVNYYAWLSGPWWCWILGTALCLIGAVLALEKIADLCSQWWWP